jgi:hypothetical protein
MRRSRGAETRGRGRRGGVHEEAELGWGGAAAGAVGRAATAAVLRAARRSSRGGDEARAVTLSWVTGGDLAADLA